MLMVPVGFKGVNVEFTQGDKGLCIGQRAVVQGKSQGNGIQSESKQRQN